jgi:hypothetical protein
VLISGISKATLFRVCIVGIAIDLVNLASGCLD